MTLAYQCGIRLWAPNCVPFSPLFSFVIYTFWETGDRLLKQPLVHTVTSFNLCFNTALQTLKRSPKHSKSISLFYKIVRKYTTKRSQPITTRPSCIQTAELYCNLIKLDFHTLGNRIELEKTELEKIELGKTRKAMQNCIPILR